ncbi:histidine kinase [Niabella pedocola]|uniref:Histidine kinase n=1 Tax=Niabella pedocola TaxID=1752077 RepID=A0ABS8PJS4_9BACT|nr:histidine kinase [Niabella pedocola]MCD2421231.1 histidine kinase [Niabella pedocola]
MNLRAQKYFVPGMHLLVWTVLYIIPFITIAGEPFGGLPRGYFPISNLFHIGIFYLNVYVLYPYLLTRKRWWLYIVCVFATVIISYQVKLLFLQQNPAFLLTEENRRIIFFAVIPFLLTGILFRLISDRVKFERLEKEARAQQLSSELKFLRSQMSPHFLFNMMTNMVALARQKSDILEPSLIRLSDLLRYMLYDSQNSRISIPNEADHLHNYIALQRLRFDNDVKINVAINVNNTDRQIEPMLLIPFVENAFKHGIGLVEDAFISIQLTEIENALTFDIANNYSENSGSKDKNSGIGLTNVKNRLQLLYPARHELVITDSGHIFAVHLKLTLI